MSVFDTPFDHSLQAACDEIDPQQDLLLTPNKRLSRFLVSRYDALQGERSFPSLRCLSYHAWLQELWLDAQLLNDDERLNSLLLTPLQETLLWQRVLGEHPETPALINELATAAQAQRAYGLIHEWHLDRAKLQAIARSQQENLSFWHWVDDFERRLARNNWLCATLLPALLETQVSNLERVLPRRIFHYGFDVLSPAQARWLQSLQEHGHAVQELSLKVSRSACRKASFADAAQQLQAAARWASERVAADPKQRIAVVVPELAQCRASVERVFLREFEPQYLLPDRAQHATAFNISAAQSLQQMPMIDAALKALRCGDIELSTAGYMTIEHLAALLHSPFLGLAAERAERAQLDVLLRNDHEPRLSFHKMRALAAGLAEADRCVDWSARLSVLSRLHRQQQKSAYPSEWIPAWLGLLKTWGWPGERDLDTLEYQQWQSWQEVLEEYSGLDEVLGRLGFAAALAALEQALSAKEFQAQTVDSPVQILGLLEAAGLPFDAMWIADLDDESWPPSPRPNPLLPLSVQRELELPQSSPAREHEFATRLTVRLTDSCTLIVGSHARTKADKAVSASPLIESWPALEWQFAGAPTFEDILFASRDIETCLDHVGPRVAHLDGVRGGSQIIKSQSHCPFQAFARFRLHSNEIQEPSQGLTAAERGNLLHHVMELLWNKLKNQERLLEKSEEELARVISQANERAFAALQRRRYIGPRLVELEGRRLTELVLKWLRLEAQRPPFKVLMKEGRKTLKLEKLPIRLRYDRVDELADGSLFVVDYKTGRTSVRDWAGARPEEPQVPLYAVANARRATAAAFGQLSGDEVAFKGIALDADVAPGLSDANYPGKMDLPQGWPLILEHWRQVLSRLVREFLAGTATVDPKDPLNTCRYCELHSLCRIREQFDFDAERDLADQEADEGLESGHE